MSDQWRSRPNFRHTDRVVKRAVGVSEDGCTNGMTMVGRKRSISSRYGGGSDDGNQHYYKRQQGECHGPTSLNDVHLDKDDLRFKLMQKNKVRKSQNNDSWGNVDLRDTLSSRTSQPPVNSKLMYPTEAAFSTRRAVPELRDARITRQSMFEPGDTAVLGRSQSSRNTSGLSMLDPGRTYPSWTLNNSRRLSPERISHHPATARGLSPERSSEALQRSLELQRSLVRAYGDERSSSCLRISPSRPVCTSTYMRRSSIPAAPVTRIAPPPAPYPQGSGIAQKIPSMGDGYATVESLLRSMGLEKYAIYFKAEEIDMNAFRQLGDSDLKELGIPMGPRKKILQAITSTFRRFPRGSM